MEGEETSNGRCYICVKVVLYTLLTQLIEAKVAEPERAEPLLATRSFLCVKARFERDLW